MPAREIAKNLNRSIKSIENAAHRLSLYSALAGGNLNPERKKADFWLERTKLAKELFLKPDPITKWNIRTKDDHIYLIPLTCLHVGHICADHEYLKGHLDWIKEYPDAYWLGMGDYAELATRYSIGSGVYTQVMPATEQYEMVEALLAPIADKCLGLIIGNHDERAIKEVGYNPVALLAKTLKVRYLGYGGLIDLNLNEINYLIYAVHGRTSARELHTKMYHCNKLQQVAPNADIFLHGHVHELHEWAKARVGSDRKQLFALTGHFLDYENSYAQALNLPPGKKGIARIRLDSTKFDPHISI